MVKKYCKPATSSRNAPGSEPVHPILQLKRSVGGDDLARKFQEADLATDLGDHDLAIHLYQDILHAKPDFVPGWINLGLVYNRKKQWEQGLECFNKAESLDAKDPELLLNRAIAYSELNEQETAEQDLKKLLALYPADPDARLNLAEIYVEQERGQEALDLIYDYLTRFPNDTEMQDKYFQICMMFGVLKELGRIFPVVLPGNKKNIAHMRVMLGYLFENKNPNLGEQFCQELLAYADKGEIPEEQVLGRIDLATNTVSRAEFGQAEKLLEEAEKIARDNFLVLELGYVYNAQGTVYHTLRLYDQAIALYKKALDQADLMDNSPLAVIAINNIGHVMASTRELAQAEELFHNVVAICERIHDHEGIAFAYNYLAAIYILQEKYDPAAEFAIKALDLAKKLDKKRELMRSHFLLAKIYAKQLFKDKALKELDLAEFYASEHGGEHDRFEFLVDKALFLQETRDLEGAKGAMQSAVELLDSWVIKTQKPEQYNLPAFKSALRDKLGELSALLANDALPLDERSQMVYFMKKICEAVPSNPEIVDDPQIRAQLPDFLREILKQNVGLRDQVTQLTKSNDEIETQLRALKAKLAEVPTRQECVSFWTIALGPDVWNNFKPELQAELSFAHVIAEYGKSDPRFYPDAVKHYAVAVESDFTGRFRQVVANRDIQFPAPDKSYGRFPNQTLRVLQDFTTRGANIYLGSIPFVLAPITNASDPLSGSEAYQKLRKIFHTVLSMVNDLIRLTRGNNSGTTKEDFFATFRNRVSHRASFQCSEAELAAYRGRTVEILKTNASIFGNL